MNKSLVGACLGAGLAMACGSAIAGPDVTLCELYQIFQPNNARSGSEVGFGIATTSWNVGDQDLLWHANPDVRHPFIAMNLFRLKTVDGSERFEQIGMSWLKHGFAALNDAQCDGMGADCEASGFPGFDTLVPGCTDTYSAGLNSDQDNLGPRYEVNPWTGGFVYNDSVLQTGGGPPTNGGPSRRLWVHDNDLDSAQNPGATYYAEGYYVAHDDVNVMNSAAWKQAIPSGSPGGTWSFSGPIASFQIFPNTGFAIDAWTGAQQTILAQEVPVIDDDLPNASPDGRCILAAKATDLGGGMWHYEYALYNVDMDRQVDGFSIAVPAGVNVTNIGWSGVQHHNEPTAWVGGPSIDNAPWSGSFVTAGAGGEVTWTTTTNPLRWGMMYNFRFDADTAPAEISDNVTLSHFRPGTPETISGKTISPSEPPAPNCPGDANGDDLVDINDLNLVLGNFGSAGPAGDVNGDNAVDIVDLNQVLGNFGEAC